ncbi:hypothetical protein Ancab_022160, partial [Ancistrocladus abbreviatus]
MVLAKRKSRKSSVVGPSIGGYVSSLRKTSTGAFMEDETDLIKKGEEEDILASSTNKTSPVYSKKVGLDRWDEGSIGPTIPWPSSGMDQCDLFLCEERAIYPKEVKCSMGCPGGKRPKCSGANSSKTKKVSLNRKQRAFNSKCPSTKKARSVFNHRGEKADDVEIS